LKVAAVGLGEASSGEPARWEEVSRWLERQPEPAEEEKKGPAPPLRHALPDLELNI
jgi:hypothetical protein